MTPGKDCNLFGAAFELHLAAVSARQPADGLMIVLPDETYSAAIAKAESSVLGRHWMKKAKRTTRGFSLFGVHILPASAVVVSA